MSEESHGEYKQRKIMDVYTETKEAIRGNDICIEDKISNLPDEILICILSFLPTKNSVRTSVLSKRWNPVWTFVPTLSIPSDYRNLTKRKKSNLLDFVDRVLIGQKMPCLENINICCSGLKRSHVSSWMSAAAKLDVKVLKFAYMSSRGCLCSIPSCLFTMKNVVRLEFELKVLLRFPVMSACFPNLKELILRSIFYANCESIQNLLLSCPVLEEFIIQRGGPDNLRTLNVSSLSLKRLSLLHYMSQDKIDHVPKIIIDCPAVEYICIHDKVNTDYVVKDLSSLINAKIEFPYDFYLTPGFSRFPWALFEFLPMISDVKSLSIADSTLPLISYNSSMVPTFPNVTYLRLYASGFVERNAKGIINFIKSTPKLEVLICEGLSFSDEEFDRSDVPNCLISHLKTIEVDGYLGKNYVEKISFFLENAKVLKNLSVKRRGGEKLKKLSCCSSTCRISLS